MSGALRILCVHGVGDRHPDVAWQDDWKEAIEGSVRRWDPSCGLDRPLARQHDQWKYGWLHTVSLHRKL